MTGQLCTIKKRKLSLQLKNAIILIENITSTLSLLQWNGWSISITLKL